MSRIIPLLLLLLASLPLQAETVRDLYSARVTADSRSQQALQVASREALAQVLVKVSGSPAVLQNPEVAASLGGARNLVQQYSFLDDNPAGGVDVRFEFNGPSVVEIVTGAGEPLWTANRPAVLVWLVQDGPAGPAFVNRDTAPELTDELLQAFSRRGVPLQMPLFDLADTAALRPQEVARLYQPAVEVASRRYNREYVLMGHVQALPSGDAGARWALLADGQRLDTAVESLPLAQALDSGVDLAAQTMAARYAVAPTGEGVEGVLISVSGVDSYSDYAAVLSWLEGVELIDQVRLVRVQGERMQLRLLAQVDADQLAGIIALNDRFVPVPSGYTEEQLSYRWQN